MDCLLSSRRAAVMRRMLLLGVSVKPPSSGTAHQPCPPAPLECLARPGLGKVFHPDHLEKGILGDR